MSAALARKTWVPAVSPTRVAEVGVQVLIALVVTLPSREHVVVQLKTLDRRPKAAAWATRKDPLAGPLVMVVSIAAGMTWLDAAEAASADAVGGDDGEGVGGAVGEPGDGAVVAPPVTVRCSAGRAGDRVPGDGRPVARGGGPRHRGLTVPPDALMAVGRSGTPAGVTGCWTPVAGRCRWRWWPRR